MPLTLQPETALPWAFLASPALSSLSPPPPPDGRDASGVRLRRCGGGRGGRVRGDKRGGPWLSPLHSRESSTSASSQV